MQDLFQWICFHFFELRLKSALGDSITYHCEPERQALSIIKTSAQSAKPNSRCLGLATVTTETRCLHSLAAIFCFIIYRTVRIWGHSKSTFTQDSRSLIPSLFALARFRAPTSHPRYVCFGQNSPSISILVKFREKKLINSTSIFG